MKKYIRMLSWIGIVIMLFLMFRITYNDETRSNRALWKGNKILNKNYSEALSNYDKAIKLNPENYEAFRERAKLYEIYSDSLALRDYKKIIEIYDDGKNKEVTWAFMVADAYNKIGDDYQKRKDYRKAIAEYSKAIKIWDSSQGYCGRGMCYLDGFNDTIKALDDFTKSIDVKRNNYNAYYERGKLYCNQKKYEEAITDLNSALSISPKQGDAYAARCIAYSRLNKKKEAMEDYQQAINYKPELKFYLMEVK